MDIVIRRMGTDDYDIADRLIKQVHDIHVAARPDMYRAAEHPYAKSDFEGTVRDDNMIALIAECGGEAVGMCLVALRESPDNPLMIRRTVAFMEALCVDAGHRGQGIGKALCERAGNEAKQRGAKKMELMVWNFNNGAISFYEGMGMTQQRCFMEKLL